MPAQRPAPTLDDVRRAIQPPRRNHPTLPRRGSHHDRRPGGWIPTATTPRRTLPTLDQIERNMT